MDNAEIRRTLATAAAERGHSLAALSAAIRRNAAYLHQFVTRGSPRMLAERDRQVLAAMLDLPESALGAPPPEEDGFRVPRLAVEASAGPGAEPGEEERTGTAALDPALARSLGLSPGRAAVIRVRGSSMEPGLVDGDEVVVDTGDRTPDATPRVYVVRIDGAVMIKRVSRGKRRLIVRSDNPGAEPVGKGEPEVIGRAVWRMGVKL